MHDTISVPVSKKSKQEYWSQHVENWRSSGLSQIQYCKNQQLKLPTFQYRKSKLNRFSLSRPLLPVTVKSTIASTTSSFPSGVSLSYNDQFNIQLEIGFNQDTLRGVFDLLESRSCFATIT